MKYLNFLLAVLLASAARGAEIKSWGGTATDAFLNQAPSALNIYRSGSSNLVTISWLTVANPISGSVTGASGSSPASALTGTTLAAGVVNSSLTSVGTLANLTVTAPISGNLAGNATTATALQTGRNINGVFFNGTANITIPVAASDITGVVAIANGGTGQTTARAAIDALSVKGSDVASATTTDLSATTGDFVDVTGTTTITGLGTASAGVERTVRFTGILTLTHNATSLILPGSANITTVGGDRAIFRSLGSGNWLCVDFIPSTVTGSGPTVLGNNPIFTTGIQAAAETISGTGGAGFIQYPAQSSAPSAPVGGFRQYADSSGRLSWIRADGFTRTFDATLTGNRVYTLPDASITFARTDAAQTFTGGQTFSTAIGVGTTATTVPFLVKAAGTGSLLGGQLISSTTANKLVAFYDNASDAGRFSMWNGTVLKTDMQANVNGGRLFLSGTGGTSVIALDGIGNSFININNFGVGTTAPDRTVEINHATGLNLRLTYNDSDGSAATFADFQLTSGGVLSINPTGATIKQGAGDAASPVAQTRTVQSVVAGTSNGNGATATYAGSASTGSGTGGSHVFTVTPSGGSGTSVNAQVATVTMAANLNTTFAGPVILKGYTVATLPATPVQGMTAFVTDATSPLFANTVVGGGSVVIPVFYDGTNWICH